MPPWSNKRWDDMAKRDQFEFLPAALEVLESTDRRVLTLRITLNEGPVEGNEDESGTRPSDSSVGSGLG